MAAVEVDSDKDANTQIGHLAIVRLYEYFLISTFRLLFDTISTPRKELHGAQCKVIADV